jgi:hypothetical protein
MSETNSELIAALSFHTHAAFLAGKIPREYPIFDKNGTRYLDIADAYTKYYKQLFSYDRRSLVVKLITKKFTLYPHLVMEITTYGGTKCISSNTITEALPEINVNSARRLIVQAYNDVVVQPPHLFVL